MRKSQKNTLKAMRKYLSKGERRKVAATKSGSGGVEEAANTETKREKQENQKKNLIKLTPIVKDDPNRVTYARKVIEFFLNDYSKKFTMYTVKTCKLLQG